MKKITILFFTVFLTANTFAQTFTSPDILIDSKLDFDFSGLLITKFRTLLKNNNMSDPFSASFKEPILLNEAEIGTMLPATSKELIRDFGNAVGLNLIHAETKVWIHGLAYEVKGFKTNLKALKQEVEGLTVGTDFSADEVSVTADKISLSLVIPGKNNSPVFNVDIIKPAILAQEEKLIKFFAEIKLQDNQDHFKLQIKKANFDQMSKGLVLNSNDIRIDYERILFPKVSLKFGNKTINFSPLKIESLIRNNHQAIKGILLAQAAKTLRSNTSEAAFKVLEQYKLNKEYWVETRALQSQVQLGKFASTNGENLEINMPGDFCTLEKFDQLKQHCIYNKTTKTSVTRLNQSFHKESVNVMKELMSHGDANIVASISEDYLNKLLVTTYDAGLWKEALDEAGVTLGPNKVIMRLDKRGESGTLLMDVIYKPSKIEKLLTGSKVIRFPLVLDISLRIEKHDEEPVVIIRLNDVDSSDETLIYGRPQENIISTVKDVPRFKGKVANAIRERLSVLRSKDLIELRYPEFKGLGLDKVDFLSDGLGRMNAIMKLEDLIEENG
jgi:hypothetical protein